MSWSSDARNSVLAARRDLFNGGTLQLATDGTFSTILATYTFNSPSTGTITSASASFSLVSTSVTASASGNAEAWRIRNSSNATVYDRSDADAISATGGGGAIVLEQATTAIVSGQTVTITTSTITEPAGL